VPVRKLPWEAGATPVAAAPINSAARDLSDKRAKLEPLLRSVEEMKQAMAQ